MAWISWWNKRQACDEHLNLDQASRIRVWQDDEGAWQARVQIGGERVCLHGELAERVADYLAEEEATPGGDGEPLSVWQLLDRGDRERAAAKPAG